MKRQLLGCLAAGLFLGATYGTAEAVTIDYAHLDQGAVINSTSSALDDPSQIAGGATESDARDVIGGSFTQYYSGEVGRFMFNRYDSDQWIIVDLGMVRKIDRFGARFVAPPYDREVWDYIGVYAGMDLNNLQEVGHIGTKNDGIQDVFDENATALHPLASKFFELETPMTARYVLYEFGEYSHDYGGGSRVLDVYAFGDDQNNPDPVEKITADFRSTRLGYRAECDYNSLDYDYVECINTIGTTAYDNSIPNFLLEARLEQDLSMLQNSVNVLDPTYYHDLECFFTNEARVINLADNKKYLLRGSACTVGLADPVEDIPVEDDPNNLEQIEKITDDFHSTRLGIYADCDYNSPDYVDCANTSVTALFDYSVDNSTLEQSLEDNLVILQNSVFAIDPLYYHDLQCSFSGEGRVVDWYGEGKYMIRPSICTVGVADHKEKITSDFRSIRLGSRAVCAVDPESDAEVRCLTTFATTLYDSSVDNGILEERLAQDLTMLEDSVYAISPNYYRDLNCSFYGEAQVVDYAYGEDQKYMLRSVICNIDLGGL
ncbi:MAG: discoidin domain-containing protein [Thermodesulfobacteriota bacterium]